MNAQPLSRGSLSTIRTYEEFFILCQSLSKIGERDVFEFLFPIAASVRGDNANVIAGFALLELEPRCPMSCEATIEFISNSNWDVSNREIPFYVVSQFGKWKVGDAIQAFLENVDKSDKQKRYVEAIWYWAREPSVKLTEKLFYWEWHEDIEGPDA